MRRSTLCIAAIATALTGCAAGSVMIGAQYVSYYDPSLVRYAARSGELPVVVRGAPFGDPAHDPANVVAAMTTPAWLEAVRFAPRAAADGADIYRLVLLFGSTTAEAIDNDPCAASPSKAGGRGGGAYVQATFCAGPKLVSTLIAQGGVAKSAADPQFRQLMDQIIINLLPASPQGKGAGGGNGGAGGGGGG